MRPIIPCILALVFAGGVHADSIFPVLPALPVDADAGIDDGIWVGHFAAGYSSNTGNTESSTLNARVLVGYMHGRYRHALNFTGNRTTDATGTIGERTVLAGKSDFRIDDAQYLFLTAQYEQDRFAGFDRRTSEAVGYGRHFIGTERHQIDGELGVGARQVRYVDGTRDNVAIMRLAASWKWQVSDSTEFISQLMLQNGNDNRFTESVTSLKTNLIGSLFSSLSYTVKHNSVVPAGVVRTDTLTTIQLEYRF